jgi:hypothetical protein
MQRTAAVADALARGSSALVELQSASTLEEARHAWLDFLFDIERVWNKLQAHYSKSPKWGGWCSPYVKARKQDQLLQYLQQARNAEEHTLDETTALVPGRVTGIQSAMPNKPVHIESLQIHRGSMRLEAAPGTLEILVSPPQMVLQRRRTEGSPMPCRRLILAAGQTRETSSPWLKWPLSTTRWQRIRLRPSFVSSVRATTGRRTRRAGIAPSRLIPRLRVLCSGIARPLTTPSKAPAHREFVEARAE